MKTMTKSNLSTPAFNTASNIHLPPQEASNTLSKLSNTQSTILEAARRIFIRDGYEAANIRTIAIESGFSKPTLYANFGSKERLFEALITNTCAQIKPPEIHVASSHSAGRILTKLAENYRQTVLSPEFIEFYRLVISEAKRFPELGAIFYRCGPQASRKVLADLLKQLGEKKILPHIKDPETAAEQFEALVLEPIKVRAFFLTDTTITKKQVNRFIESAITTFLSAYQLEPPL